MYIFMHTEFLLSFVIQPEFPFSLVVPEDHEAYRKAHVRIFRQIVEPLTCGMPAETNLSTSVVAQSCWCLYENHHAARTLKISSARVTFSPKLI